MKHFKEILHKVKSKLPKVSAITLFAFWLSTVLMKPFSFSASAFLSNPEKSDFAITDFYSILADSREVREVDREIAIINISGLDREGIATLLDTVATLQPAAVGLDVAFAEPRDTDTDNHLLIAISQCPNIVLATSVTTSDTIPGTFRYADRSFFIHELPGIGEGIATFPTRYAKSTIREFCPSFTISPGNHDVPSFVSAIIRTASPGAETRLHARNLSKEAISFHSRTFLTFTPEEIPLNRSLLQGRILLIGDVDDPIDKHATPVTSTMAGVVIHAHALATVLHGHYLTPLSSTGNIALALLLCFGIILTASMLPVKVKGLVIRTLQIILLLLVVYIGYMLFLRNGIVVDFSYALLMIAFGMFANDLWLGSEYLIDRYITPRWRSLRSRRAARRAPTE